MGIRLADTLEPMADFPSAYAKDIAFNDGDTLQEKLDTGSLGGGGVGYKQLSQAEYDALTEDEKLDGREYRTYDTGHIYKLGVEYGKEDAIYTTLGELGLAAPVTVGEIFNAMPNKSMAIIACEGREGNTDGAEVHVSDVPVSFGVLTIKKNEIGRFSIEYQISLQGSVCNVKRWIGTLKGADGTGLYWKQLSAEPTFVTLNDIGLGANATFQDVVDALPKGGSALLGVKDFTNYQTIFPYEEGNDQFARVHIVKGVADGSCMYARWFRKDGAKEAIASFNINDNKFYGWRPIFTNYYTSLAQLGLTAPVSIGEAFNAMPDKSQLMLNVNNSANTDATVTDAPHNQGVLVINKHNNGRFSIEFNYSLGGNGNTIRKWIGTLKGSDGTGLNWKEVAYSDDHHMKTYSSLSDLGLDTTATINDIINKMANCSIFVYKTDVFDLTQYENLQHATVTVIKHSANRIQVLMTDKNTGNLYVGRMDNTNLFVGWRSCTFHRVVAQEKAGYFKFKPTNDGGFDQPLRIAVTDNYGGMINISGAKPSASQYKPFKCIRLSNGEYTNYDAIKVANNKMLKLFFYDGYFYLKVTTYTTCTFTGLIEAPTYVETFDETNAEEIPIRSVFDTPYNDGYADPSIIAVGDTDSADGVIKTLTTLGFTEDVMTWDTGEYRISHVGGLTNLPSEITEEKPGLRIAHYDMKKWGSNHNPNASTYGCRQSVLYYKGDVYVRYTESGASAGVLIADTGWNNISNKKSIKFNSKTFKIDITKGNENWNGNMKFGYCIDESYGEIIISSLGKTEVMWDHSTGVRYVKSVTYTIDPNNKAHITIGIELYDVSYGIHQLEIIGDFARVNSITGDAFTGTSVAKRGATRGRNNGVGILCEVADLGLTTPCTTVQIAQAMRNLTNSMNRIPTNGMIGIFDNGGNKITDAPSEYGLLTINAYGYDRVMIRYDGIGASTYAGSWIGKVKGSGGTFSEVTWERTDNMYSTGEIAIGTWIDGSTIYRKVLPISDIDAKTSSSTVELGDAPVSEQNMIKIEGFVNLIGNQCFIHYPSIADEDGYINATVKIANGKFKLSGTWKYPINKGAIIMEYIKS